MLDLLSLPAEEGQRLLGLGLCPKGSTATHCAARAWGHGHAPRSSLAVGTLPGLCAQWWALHAGLRPLPGAFLPEEEPESPGAPCWVGQRLSRNEGLASHGACVGTRRRGTASPALLVE